MAPEKKPRVGAAPEELQKGSVVIFGDKQRGVVRDAFPPLDQYWIAEEGAEDLVRDEFGEIVAFRAEDLTVPPAPPQPVKPSGPRRVRVLVLGTEPQMLQILQHFGEPNSTTRSEPQQLLAIPCASCACGPSCLRFDPTKREMCDKVSCPLMQLALEGIDDPMHALAARLRPDIFIDVRAFHLKHALEQTGPDLLRLHDYYCLSAVSLPFGLEEIEARSGPERHRMEEVCCQIDLGASADFPIKEGESLEAAAKRALAQACGIRLSDAIWSEELQLHLRRRAGVDLPLKFWEGLDTKVSLVMLPRDSPGATLEAGLLSFKSSASGDAGPARASSAPGGPARAQRDAVADVGTVGGKTISQWKSEQDILFKDLPKLPAGWIRVRSRKTEEVYFYNATTHASQFDRPLPEGWTKEKSKSNGKAYYFNAKKRKSSYEFPVE